MPETTLAKMETYLTFTLAGETFAVDVAGVREVLELTAITRVPRTPEFMRGVINLRGSVVPVIDMRLKFGLPASTDTVNTCIVVMEVTLDGEKTVIGALADSVREVFDLASDRIEPPPRIGTRLNTEFIRGMGEYNGRFTIILDTDRVFSADELSLADAIREAPAQRDAAPAAGCAQNGDGGEDPD